MSDRSSATFRQPISATDERLGENFVEEVFGRLGVKVQRRGHGS